MRIWPIFKKEMRLYFTSPVAWVVLTIFLFIAGYFFASIFSFFSQASIQSAMNPQIQIETFNISGAWIQDAYKNLCPIVCPIRGLSVLSKLAPERSQLGAQL